MRRLNRRLTNLETQQDLIYSNFVQSSLDGDKVGHSLQEIDCSDVAERKSIVKRMLKAGAVMGVKFSNK